MTVKTAIYSIAFFAISCNSSAQKEAQDVMKGIQAQTAKVKAGMIATTQNGYMMRAKIDGKQWVADAMHEPYNAGRIVGESSDGEKMIGLNFYSRAKNYETGMVEKIEEHSAADLRTGDGTGFYGGTHGEIHITRVDDNWIEGTFYFTATNEFNPAKVVVSDGFFRIPMKETD